MNFHEYYLSALSRESGENLSPLEQSAAIRNSHVRIYNEGLSSLSNAASCDLLSHGLEEYHQSCNDPDEGSMKDMISAVNTLMKGKISTRHCANWKSNLRSSGFDAKSVLLKSLAKSGHCNAQNGQPCTANQPTDEELKTFFKKRDFKSSMPKMLEVSNLVSNNDQPEDKSISNNNYKGKFVLKNESQYSVKTFDSTAKSTGISNSDPVVTNKPHFSNTKFSNVNNANNFKSNVAQNNNFTLNKNQKIIQTNSIEDKKEHEPINNNVFRTARTELQIQNKRKYGSSYQNNQNSAGGSNVLIKKSLGTTRSNVQSKFRPPTLPDSPEQKSSSQDSEEIEDERLKHIDPKMIEFIRSEIIDSSAPISWDDIAGLNFAKSAIQEAVVWPLLRPDIFTGLRRPPKGILLFGPPGTGKTLIGKCIASQCQATFFSISASSLTSKWIGDGEKMVRALFAVARCHQPAVVFIDEIDSMLTQRSDTEHEASRRIKTEFLVQLDGAATGDEDRFLVIGATNRPQELDEAARRRLVKRLYIPLPDIDARKQIVQRLMSTERNSLSDEDVEKISIMTDGYSGADMRSLCAEAALGPIRAVPLSQITNIQQDEVRPVNAADFESALTRVRPSVSGKDLHQYIEWDNTYGSGSALR